MEFNKVIQKRRSVRKFKNDPIPDSLIREVIEAGRLAPSGLNVQPWRYIVVKSEEKREAISKNVSSQHAENAPVLIICTIDLNAYAELPLRIKELVDIGALKNAPYLGPSANDLFNDEVWLKINGATNAAISITHMLLKATDLGLGSCWLGVFDECEIKKIAELDQNFFITALLTLGYPDESPDPRPRLPLDKIFLKII